MGRPPEPRGLGHTLVTVDFVDRDGTTELILTQEGFPHEVSREDHSTGWTGCFDSMERLLSATEGGES